MLSNDTLASHQEAAAFISLCPLVAKGHAASWFYTRMNAKGGAQLPLVFDEAAEQRNSAQIRRRERC